MQNITLQTIKSAYNKLKSYIYENNTILYLCISLENCDKERLI